MVEGLVNILTPAYNCEAYLSRLLDSIVIQTYPKIEMWIIDDGSTDNTALVIRKYIDAFSERGYKLNYKKQKNSGQSCAINNGLKLLNGEFLVWPDSDDWYKTRDAIEQLVCTLQQAPINVGMVRCRYEKIEEKSMNVIGHTDTIQIGKHNSFFEEVLFDKIKFSMEPGGIMVKIKYLDNYIPKRDIYVEKNAGQNFQIIYPYLYYSDCLVLDKILYCYLVRKSSHSRGQFSGYDKEIERLQIYERTLLSTILNLDIDNTLKIEYENKIKFKYKYYKMQLTFKYGYYSIYRKEYKKINDNLLNIFMTKQDKIKYYLSFLPYGTFLFKIITVSLKSKNRSLK